MGDLTQMTTLAESQLFAESRIVGRGLATETAARRLIRGVPWDEAGVPGPSAGNGSAMRAGPVGLLYGDDLLWRRGPAKCMLNLVFAS